MPTPSKSKKSKKSVKAKKTSSKQSKGQKTAGKKKSPRKSSSQQKGARRLVLAAAAYADLLSNPLVREVVIGKDYGDGPLTVADLERGWASMENFMSLNGLLEKAEKSDQTSEPAFEQQTAITRFTSGVSRRLASLRTHSAKLLSRLRQTTARLLLTCVLLLDGPVSRLLTATSSRKTVIALQNYFGLKLMSLKAAAEGRTATVSRGAEPGVAGRLYFLYDSGHKESPLFAVQGCGFRYPVDTFKKGIQYEGLFKEVSND